MSGGKVAGRSAAWTVCGICLVCSKGVADEGAGMDAAMRGRANGGDVDRLSDRRSKDGEGG